MRKGGGGGGHGGGGGGHGGGFGGGGFGGHGGGFGSGHGGSAWPGDSAVAAASALAQPAFPGAVSSGIAVTVTKATTTAGTRRIARIGAITATHAPEVA